MFRNKFLKVGIFVLIFTTASFVRAALSAPRIGQMHLDLEISGQQMHSMIRESGRLYRGSPLEALLEVGKRNLDYFEHLNSLRPEDQKLLMTTPGTQNGIPIDKPSESSPSLIQKESDDLRKDLPPQMEAILYSGAAFTDNVPGGLSDQDYVTLARRANKLYQHAARWILQEPYLSEYSEQMQFDIRGYYFLQQETDLDRKLKDFKQLAAADQTRLKSYLLGQCLNAQGPKYNCNNDFTKSLKQTGSATDFFNKYVSQAKETWDSYFLITQKRSDVKWSSQNPNLTLVPFIDPKSVNVFDYLKINIEDEWKWNGWQLKLDFVSAGDPDLITHVEFQPGVTPHVEGLGGNTIVMDANVSLKDYDNQWTIRHEYGHTLGFPDCYIEFYDDARGVMINYQIDINNLMCSRRGHLQEKHFLEMKRVYFK